MKNKSINKRYLILTAIFITACIIFVLQLLNWQVVNGQEYLQKANSSNSYTQTISAPRGEILDRNGVGLAINTNSYNVVFNKIYVDEDSENDLILQLIDIFNSKGEKWIDELPIVIENGEYKFKDGEDSAVAQLKSDYRLNSYATAENCIDRMASKQWYNCENYSMEEKREILSVHYNMNQTGYDYGTPYVFASNVSNNMVAIISENSAQLPGIQISTDSQRSYPNGTIAPHIIGTIGAISKSEYESKADTGLYQLDSRIGKTGIEAALEDTLIGTPGEKQFETTSDGSTSDSTVTIPASAGDTVYLTIDSRLQEVAAQALEQACTSAQKKAKKGEIVTGSVVMLDVNDFSVLCAQSYPSYDLNKAYTDKNYYSDLSTDEVNKPLIARAFEGTYPIGSTMKPAVALAALEEGVITPSTVFNCTHTYMRFAPGFTPTCLGTHGYLSLDRALAVSCNIFFYETSYQLGINTLNEYQTRLGLGQKTGVEIPEQAGVLAGPKEREAGGGTWYQGDTVMAGIGQSDNLITPIQLATYCATIANDGTRLKTHLVEKTTDYSRQNILSENNSDNAEVMADLGVSQENLDIVKSDMRGVVTRSDGTAHSTLGSYDIPVAAKTGTAESFQSDGVTSATDHVTLMVFAPYDDPQIAIGIVLEYGSSGTYTANIAKALMDEYFTEVNPYTAN